MYLIVKCPYCQYLFITTSTKVVRCQRCNRSFTVNPKKDLSTKRVLYYTNDIYEARKKLTELRIKYDSIRNINNTIV